MMDEAGALTSLAAKNLNAARTSEECSASSFCIDPENPVYFPEEGDFSGTYGSNSKNIHYKVYNTSTAVAAFPLLRVYVSSTSNPVKEYTLQSV